MSTEMQVFNFETNTIRVFEFDGVVWFVGKDAATTLGYKNTRDAVNTHCRKAKSLIELGVAVGDSTLDPQTKMIPESDLYRMTMKSTLESAEKFQDWVVEDVLPAIRKTGSYSKSLSPAELLLQQCQMLVDQERRVRSLEVEYSKIKEDAKETNERLNQIETASDYFTILGWFRYVLNQSITLADAAYRGKIASKYCRKHGVEMGSVPDPRFGMAKTYPKWVLDELFIEE